MATYTPLIDVNNEEIVTADSVAFYVLGGFVDETALKAFAQKVVTYTESKTTYIISSLTTNADSVDITIDKASSGGGVTPEPTPVEGKFSYGISDIKMLEYLNSVDVTIVDSVNNTTTKNYVPFVDGTINVNIKGNATLTIQLNYTGKIDWNTNTFTISASVNNVVTNYDYKGEPISITVKDGDSVSFSFKQETFQPNSNGVTDSTGTVQNNAFVEFQAMSVPVEDLWQKLGTTTLNDLAGIDINQILSEWGMEVAGLPGDFGGVENYTTAIFGVIGEIGYEASFGNITAMFGIENKIAVGTKLAPIFIFFSGEIGENGNYVTEFILDTNSNTHINNNGELALSINSQTILKFRESASVAILLLYPNK